MNDMDDAYELYDGDSDADDVADEEDVDDDVDEDDDKEDTNEDATAKFSKSGVVDDNDVDGDGEVGVGVGDCDPSSSYSNIVVDSLRFVRLHRSSREQLLP